jgi:acyl dehydratase
MGEPQDKYMAKVIVENLQEFRELEGKNLPEGDWLTVTQEMINDFAKATQDFQWLHVDLDRIKKESPFKKPIAHGFMSIALLSKMLMDLVKIKSLQLGINYGLDKVRFPSPLFVDSEIRLYCKISNIEDYKNDGLKITWQCTVEVKGQDKPACVAEFIGLMF